MLLLNITCFIGVFFVSAYFVDIKQAENVFSVVNNKTEILKVSGKVGELKPGMEINDNIAIRNTGNNGCRVRVLTLFSDSDAEGCTEMKLNHENWQQEDDGYYYYSKVLPAGETTESLFTEIKVSEDADAENIKGFEIYVYAESINVEAGSFTGVGNHRATDCLCSGVSCEGFSNNGFRRFCTVLGISRSKTV